MSKSVWKKESKTVSGYNLNQTKHYRPGYLGGGRRVYGGAVKIEGGYHYNGSGDEFFGGADYWPNVELQFAFPAGEEALRDKFIDELKPFIDRFMKENGLEPTAEEMK